MHQYNLQLIKKLRPPIQISSFQIHGGLVVQPYLWQSSHTSGNTGGGGRSGKCSRAGRPHIPHRICQKDLCRDSGKVCIIHGSVWIYKDTVCRAQQPTPSWLHNNSMLSWLLLLFLPCNSYLSLENVNVPLPLMSCALIAELGMCCFLLQVPTRPDEVGQVCKCPVHSTAVWTDSTEFDCSFYDSSLLTKDTGGKFVVHCTEWIWHDFCIFLFNCILLLTPSALRSHSTPGPGVLGLPTPIKIRLRLQLLKPLYCSLLKCSLSSEFKPLLYLGVKSTSCYDRTCEEGTCEPSV